MDDLDTILKGDAPAEQPQGFDPEPQPAAADATGETETQAAAAPEGDAPAAPAPAEDGASPAPGHVPLDALRAERQQRQDWKEKAVRAEEQRNAMERELQELRARLSAPAPAAPQPPPQPASPPPMPDPISNPDGFAAWQQDVLLNERMNMSEVMVRSQHSDVDEMVEVFKAEAAKNPSLVAQLRAQPHPWQWAYQQAKRIKAMSEIGDDPSAYRARLEEEIRQKVLAEMQGQQPAPRQAPAVNLPPSLTTARSAAPRSAPAYTGPTPIESLFPR